MWDTDSVSDTCGKISISSGRTWSLGDCYGSVLELQHFKSLRYIKPLFFETGVSLHGLLSQLLAVEFQEYMDRIKRLNEDAWKYLDKWPREAWTRSQFRHNPKLDSICNNACEVFNSKIKEARGKPILTLLEEVRMFVMRTMAKNKVKLDNHLGLLPPVIKSRLEKVRKESRHWHAIWSGDTGYEKFEVHGRPTNHVVDLGKRLCTCQFWMLTGIPCVHACAALARVNKHPEDFCHKLITMESYKETYKYHINPIPGQAFWEQSQFNKPLAPPIKRKPGNLQTKRRKDSDEVSSSSKKSKPVTALKRQLRPFTCKYCLQKGHTKRGCEKKRAADAAQAAADAAAAAKAAEAAKAPKNASAQATATAQCHCNCYSKCNYYCYSYG
ncbi:uncharacterized protein LOC107627584 [Arachis ipaensis]|uniref:uncharacterized protein LOC107627584 n=1 Tax=Arachis ipaensis TaxID=130454 RepID=UPI0007AF47B5|nr:uncharacterized protein LOC107627584 [Arachis ipaensis]